MNLNIIIEGVGGQGVQKLGSVIRQAIVRDNPSFFITLSPEYDTVVRGGISNCHIRVTHEEVNPVVETCDFRLCLRDKIIILKTGGMFGLPSHIQSGLKEKHIGFALVGMLVARRDLPASREAFEEAVKVVFPDKKIAEMNINAFQKGFLL